MAADETKLGALHEKVAETLAKALDGTPIVEIDPETGEAKTVDVIPASAALITATIQFLKNNNVTCVPSQNNALGVLEEKMKERAAKRAERGQAKPADIAAATEHMNFLQGLPN